MSVVCEYDIYVLLLCSQFYCHFSYDIMVGWQVEEVSAFAYGELGTRVAIVSQYHMSESQVPACRVEWELRFEC